MTTYIILPTVLYIKQHSITGLKYFGKTTRDPLKYKGSGVDWIPHLKKYGSEHVITTIVFGPCTDSEVISKWAIEFSRDNNIVASDLWANCKIENGLDGAPPGPNGRKGILIGPNGPQQNPSGKPAWNKGISTGPSGPSPKKGISTGPNGKKGISTGPSPRKGIPCGPQQNPHGPRGPTGKQQNPAPEVECPHCGLVGRGGAMTRWHFDNCKMRSA